MREYFDNTRKLVPLIPSMAKNQRRRWAPLLQEGEKNTEQMRHRWFQVLVKLGGAFVVGSIGYTIVTFSCIQYAFLAVKYTPALVVLIFIDCLALARFEIILFKMSRDNSTADERDEEVENQGGEGGDVDLVWKISVEDRSSSKSSVGTPVRDSEANRRGVKGDKEGAGLASAAAKPKRKPIIKTKSARGGPGVKALRAKFEKWRKDEEEGQGSVFAQL